MKLKASFPLNDVAVYTGRTSDEIGAILRAADASDAFINDLLEFKKVLLALPHQIIPTLGKVLDYRLCERKLIRIESKTFNRGAILILLILNVVTGEHLNEIAAIFYRSENEEQATKFIDGLKDEFVIRGKKIGAQITE